MPHWKAMEQRIEEEKNTNRLLMDRLAHLEKQMVESQAKDKTQESVPPQPPTDTVSSKVEDLLSQAMTQIQNLEKKFDEQSKPTPQPAAKAHGKKTAPGSSAPGSPQPDHDGEDESDADSSDDEFIVTPSGHKVS